jgi:ankyrin repeat protein
MEINKHIFDLIKLHKFDKIYTLIKNNKVTNLDIKDTFRNYFIQYIVNYNQIKLLKLILDKVYPKILTIEKTQDITMRLDILDVDGRSILYNCIKFNYIEILKLLIEYNKLDIGISIINIKDRLGLTALHYSVIFNNFLIFEYLLKNNADPYVISNDGNNVFHIVLLYKQNQMLEYLLDNNYSLHFYDYNGDTFFQNSINYDNLDLIIKILNKTTNYNNKNTKNGLTAIHQSIIYNKIEIFKLLLDKNIDFNISDFFGNTVLHYILYEKHIAFLQLLFKYDNIKFNLSNINGDTPLHIILNYDTIDIIDIDILTKIITYTDVNLQNNEGITCLMKIIDNNWLDRFYEILIKKPLNIFIQDKFINEIKINKKLLNILVDSYYYQITFNNNFSEDWEVWCHKYDKISNLINLNDEDKLIYNKLIKLFKSSNNKNKISVEKICKENIKYTILNKNRSLPLTNNIILEIDTGIVTNMAFYTGALIDVVFGLLFLFREFNNNGLNIILDYPLTLNTNLENYYNKLGLNYKLDFSNIEILWSFQKIFYPTYFDIEIKKKILDFNYIIIPIGIEISVGSHANILFWDLKNKTLERFEPNGANYPLGFNYNPDLLDSLLETKFKTYDPSIKYYNPASFLPNVGFQILENLEIDKKIGDPNGFCCVWCIWWIYQRMLNLNYPLDTIANTLIQQIKLDNISFKNIIRNFSSKITFLRDKCLKDFKLDINLWLAGKYSDETLNKLEKKIFQFIN